MNRVLSDVPVGSGYLEAVAGLSATSGAFGHLEAGVRPIERLAAFSFAELDRQGWTAGLGARWVF